MNTIDYSMYYWKISWEGTNWVTPVYAVKIVSIWMTGANVWFSSIWLILSTLNGDGRDDDLSSDSSSNGSGSIFWSQADIPALSWCRTNVEPKKGGLGHINIPLLSDLTKQISKDYGVLLEDQGVALR